MEFSAGSSATPSHASFSAILSRLQFPHVVADTGEALQSAFAIEEILYVRSRHSPFRNEKQHDAGVDLSWPGSHRKSVERRKAHRALNAMSALEGAHRSTTAEMSDDYSSACDIGRNMGQGPGDVFVG